MRVVASAVLFCVSAGRAVVLTLVAWQAGLCARELVRVCEEADGAGQGTVALYLLWIDALSPASVGAALAVAERATQQSVPFSARRAVRLD